MKKSIKWLLMSLIMVVVLTAVVTLSFGLVTKASAKVTLRFSDWHMAEAHWLKALEEAKVIFERQYPDIKITFEPVSYGEKETKYITASEAGQAPDVMHLHAYSLAAFIEKGYALDLTPFINKEKAGFLDAWYALP